MYSDVENDIKKSKRPNSISGHKYQENMMKGLLDNNRDVRVINSRRISPYPKYPLIIAKKSPFYANSREVGTNISFINLPIVCYISKLISLTKEMKRNIKKDEGNVILIYNSEITSCLAALMVKRKHKCIICNAIGDLSGAYGVEHVRSLRSIIIEKINAIGDAFGRKCDCFIFVTEEMSKVFNTDNRPHCVIEAMYQLDNDFGEGKEETIKPKGKNESKNIFYAGSVDLKYGIEHLLKAFTLIKDLDYLLIIAGIGDGEDTITKYAQIDKRIKYLGFISPDEVNKYQMQATVLVNPRLPDENFVKYSFPSKTVECLACGTPYISYRLPCNSPEYGDVILYAEESTDESLANKISEICAMSENERIKIGKKGREFVKNKKNPKMQMRKAIDMIEGSSFKILI